MASKQHSYQFTLILNNVDENTANLEDALYDAGCDDALINFRNSTVFLDFSRKSNSLETAVMSAIHDVESAAIKPQVINIAPDNLVTEAEIAKRLNVTRQIVSLWIKGERRSTHSFPKAVMKLSDRSPLWKWHEVVLWLHYHDLIKQKEIVEQAEFFANMNFALEHRNEKYQGARQELIKKLRKIS